MAFGPFSEYAPPGVYTTTNTEANVSSLVAGLRIPAIIGVGQEDLEQMDLEMVRGSSSTLDQEIVNEDVSHSWVVSDLNPTRLVLGVNDGLNVRFKVRNFPIVDGQGLGRVTNDPQRVTVTVNGTPVSVAAVRGSTGEVLLQVPPQANDQVRVTYRFHRGDTSFTDNVSDQVSADPATIITPGYAPFDVVTSFSDTLRLKVNGGVERTVSFTSSPNVAASLVVLGSTSNGAVLYRAAATGVAGNSIRVAHIEAGTSTALSVVVSGQDITVNLATDSGGVGTSTAAQVAAAVLASAPASALVVATATGTGADLAAAGAMTSLVGGQDGGSAASLKTQMDVAAIPGLTTSTFAANDGTLRLKFSADISIEILDGSANGILGLTSGQKTARTNVFRVYNIPVVDGSSGGITTTDPSKVVVKVNGTQVLASALDGKNGLISIPFAPAAGSTVTVSYWANTWQDTFDHLPNTLISSVIRAGFAAGRSDYIQGQDFVVSNQSADMSVVHWGASVDVSAIGNTPGATLFDNSQITPSLVDDRIYLGVCTRYTNTSVIPTQVSDREFVLPAVPTLGNGRDTPLSSEIFQSSANGRAALASNRPDLVEVRTGRDLTDAMTRPAAKVVAVDSETRKVTLASPVPPDHLAFATFWYNRLSDDTYTLTCKTPGPVGSGEYEIVSNLTGGQLYHVRMSGKGGGLSDTIRWPRGVEQIPDAYHAGGTPVSETVRCTFGVAPASQAVYTSTGPAPYAVYTPASSTWRMALNGQGAVSTNLAAPSRAYLVGSAVTSSSNSIVIPSGANRLDLTIDGENVSVTLPTGTVAVSTVEATINAAIDAVVAFLPTAPNNLCTAIQGAGDRVFFVLRSLAVPGALPGGFDTMSKVVVRQGTAETYLGFVTGQTVSGTSGAVCKPATLLSAKAGPYTVVSGVSDRLKVRVNGVNYTITLQAASTSASDIVSDINAALPASVGVASVGSGDKVRLTSATNSENSAIVVLDGTANTLLGFTQGDYAGQTKVSAQEICNCLMNTANIAVTSWSGTPSVNSLGAVAYPTVIEGATYLTVESLTVGTSSSVAFVGGSNTAFNVMSGIGIKPGLDGDNGAAAHDVYTVTSSDPDGSYGRGVPGQTYADTQTGLHFTILPSSDGSYTAGGWVELEVSPTFKVNPSVPSYAIPGIELLVSNTVGVGFGDTARVNTYNPSGVEPKNGDVYFISYRYQKQDFSTRLYRQFKTIEAAFGGRSSENRVTLAADLAIQNQAVILALRQVLKATNSNQASPSDFVEAISDLSTSLAGGVDPDIIVPLATHTSVYPVLMQHCSTMSQSRNAKERMGFIGFASGTVPTSAQAIAKSLGSERIVALYPDSAVISLQNELGEVFNTIVDGTFFAAAVAGAAVSPSVDVATPYTRRRIQGIARIPRVMDAVEANQTAAAGITILEDLDPVVRIRHGLTTDMSNPLTRLPTVTQIKDHVQRSARSVLDAFIGTKFLAGRTNDVIVSMTGMFKQLKQQDIVADYTGIGAEADPGDPTSLNAEAYYAPVFGLEYIPVAFNLRSRV